MPDLAHIILFLVLGAALGTLGGLFGIGGGLLAIPMLVLFFHLDEQHAQGTALVMIAPNVLAGLWSYAKHPEFDRTVAAMMAIAAVPFTYAGALFAVHGAGPGLRTAFGAFLAAIAVVFAVRALGRDTSGRRRVARPWSIAVGAFGGAVSGIFSVGGAVFAVPILSTFFGFAQATAQGMALALVAPGTVVSLATYAPAGDVEWGIGIPLAIGGFSVVRYGVALAHRLPDRTLRLLFCGLLVASALALLLRR